MTTMHTSGGTLHCGCRIIRVSLMITRGTHSLRHLSVSHWLCGRKPSFELYSFDTWLCVGRPRTVSHSLDGSKTLPWTATTFGGKDCRELFHDADQNSHSLLCEVSSHCDHCSVFSTKGSDMVAWLLFLASPSLLLSRWYVNLPLVSACDHGSSFI
jgi:hypothetical protein